MKRLGLTGSFAAIFMVTLLVVSSFLVSLPNFQLVSIAYASPDPGVAAQWEYAESLSESSSSSTSFTEKVRLTFTPNEVADWLIIITFQARHTNTGDSFEVRGELDDTYTVCLPNQEPEINNEALEYRTFGHFRVFQDLSTSEHHVDVDYRTLDSTTTMLIKNVRIVAIQIGDIDGVDNAYQEAEGGVKGTTVWTDTVEASITPTDTNKKYLIIGGLEVQPSTSTSYYAQARISVDDTTYIPVEAPAGKYWTSTTKDLGDWFSLMGYAVVTLTSDVHTVALQIKGHTTYSDYRYRRILVLRLDDVYECEYASDPTENSQTGTTWKDASTVQFTSSASDYLILASMCGRLSTSGSSFQQRFTIGDAPQVDHIDHFEEQSDASYRSFQFAEMKTLLAESQTFKNQFRACDETRTAYVKGSVIVAIKRPLPVDTPPCWSNAGTNNTVAGEPTLFHVKWTDDAGLSGFIFGINNTGTWVNDTWTPMSGTTDWSNVTKMLNSIVGVTVQWRVWANDTSNNWSDTGVLSLTTTRAVTTQLGLCFDGSGSISSSEFAIITAGIAAAVRNASQMPHDGTVELTVVQFGTGITAYARVEVALTVITTANFESIATTIEGISQIGGYTPTADGLLLTWLQMKGSPNFAVANRQVINVATNGFANRALKATPPVGWPTPPGTAWEDVAYVRDNAAAEGLDEIDAEGIGVTPESLADMQDCLVYPQPGTIAPPYNPGWVRWVADATEFAAVVGEKFIIVLQQPLACFTVSNDHPNVCETVTFNATCSYDPDGWIVNYTWNFGDSNITTVTYPIITHHYGTCGNYTVILTVADNDGLTDSTSKPIWVSVNYTLTITTTTGGTTSPSPGAHVYPCCTNVSVTAIPDTCYQFNHWELDGFDVGSTNPYTVHMDDNHTLHAVFAVTNYTLTITTTAGGTTTPSPGSYEYSCSSSVQVTATPDACYQFDHWELDGFPAGSANPYTVTMDSSHTLHAVFVITNYTLTITSSAGGTTSPSPGSYEYACSSSVDVTAIPDSCYALDHWELDGFDVGSANPYTVHMNDDHTLHAVFVYSPAPLSVSINPLSASILIGDSVAFTSTVNGGALPYTYQWYLNGAPVPGATSSSWTFTPTSTGIYYVYLKITDACSSIAQSDTAKITVTSVPVGGYSVSLTKPTAKTPLICYTMLLAIFAAVISLIKRKRK